MTSVVWLRKDQLLLALREAYQRNHRAPLCIFSYRQDIGLQKCEFGLAEGLLTKEIRGDEQNQYWLYHWTAKAEALWG